MMLISHNDPHCRHCYFDMVDGASNRELRQELRALTKVLLKLPATSGNHRDAYWMYLAVSDEIDMRGAYSPNLLQRWLFRLQRWFVV